MLEVISLGAGVQSTTMALMAAHGEIEPMPDAAIFADTGAEPADVYEHLTWLMSPNVLSFPVHIVRAGNIIDDTRAALSGGRHKKGRAATAPFFALSKRGDAAPLRRQCTDAYKTDPINAWLRERLGYKPRQRIPKDRPLARVWLGISLDEIYRMKPSRLEWIERRHPLIEHEMTRWDCRQWLKRHEYPDAPRSACTICPYRSNEEWRHLRESDPAGWAEAVAIDKAIRCGFRRLNDPDTSTGELWLHRSMQPLDEVDLRTHAERGQPDLWSAECEGICGL